MSTMVKMLEGEMKIAQPPNSLQYLDEPAWAANQRMTMTSGLNTMSATKLDVHSNKIISFLPVLFLLQWCG